MEIKDQDLNRSKYAILMTLSALLSKDERLSKQELETVGHKVAEELGLDVEDDGGSWKNTFEWDEPSQSTKSRVIRELRELNILNKSWSGFNKSDGLRDILEKLREG